MQIKYNTLLNDKYILYALQEDIGYEDLSSKYTIDKKSVGKAVAIAKEDMIIVGLDIACKIFTILDHNSIFYSKYIDGDKIHKNQVIFEITGYHLAILKGERTALNFIQRLSGIATKTKRYVDIVKNTKIKIIDTRKTTPCLRVIEKYAVKMGGGYNHRMGLYDGVLIKDNHISICGSISKAVKNIKNNISHLTKIEVETKSIKEVKEALHSNVDIIMLDNMNLNKIKEATKLIEKKAIVEISGRMSIEKIKQLIHIDVDLISVGSLTHSANAVDISMKIIK